MDRKAKKCGISLCLIMFALSGCGDDKKSDSGTRLPASLKLDDVTNDQAEDICDWLADEDTVYVPSDQEKCTSFAVAKSQNPEDCAALTKTCDASKAVDSEKGCGLTRNNFLGCQATVADLEACFEAQKAADSLYYPKISCADAGTGKERQVPVECIDLARRCPSIFDEQADGGFVCDDGFDLADDSVCNGYGDCKDDEDEDPVLCASWQDDDDDLGGNGGDGTGGVSPPEGDGGFVCADGIDIDDSRECDYYANCWGGEDEVGCEYPVNDGGFVCADGWDLTDDEKCDGWEDCNDASDEVDCPVFTCNDGSMLVLSDQCDGWQDCAAGEDEVGCTSTP